MAGSSDQTFRPGGGGGRPSLRVVVAVEVLEMGKEQEEDDEVEDDEKPWINEELGSLKYIVRLKLDCEGWEDDEEEEEEEEESGSLEWLDVLLCKVF